MTPQWITQERRAQLFKLRIRYWGQCLKGHLSCRDESHFQWATPHLETVAVPVEFKVLDKATGLVRRDITVPGWKPE